MKGFQVGDPRAVAAARKGGEVSREVRRRKALAKFYAVWPGMPVEAARFVLEDRQRAYEAGWVAGRRKPA